MEKKFGIKAISNSCGILPHTLRVWEQRYQVFSPERGSNGQRLYSEQDLTKAKLLSRLLEHGHSISSLAEYKTEELHSMAKDLQERLSFSPSTSTKKLIQEIANYKIDSVADELQHLRLSMGAKEFIFSVVLPIIREVGLLVAKGSYTVTQEHIISTILREQLTQIYLPNVGIKEREMALATPEGNLHELPIIIADILCRANRLSTRYLGAAHPAQCLGEAVNALKTPYLVLGVVSSDQWDLNKNIENYLKNVDQYLERKVTVILGGVKEMKLPNFQNIEEIIFLNSLEEFDQYLGGL